MIYIHIFMYNTLLENILINKRNVFFYSSYFTFSCAGGHRLHNQYVKYSTSKFNQTL